MIDFDELKDYNNFENFDYNIKTTLGNIEKTNKQTNAFCRIYKDEFLLNAEKIKEDIKKNGNKKKLAGIIVGIKDLICYKNHCVNAASKILTNFTSPFSATVVDRILKENGLIIGHQNCDEFGMGSSNKNSVYGEAHNALDFKKTPGGSSGGSAAAIQTDMCHVSLGTDTGGSVRQPAAFCGIIGFKPSYGVISRHGIIAHSSSFDTVGILSKKIRYIEDVFKVISGKDYYDFSLYDKDILKEKTKEKYRIAYLADTLNYCGLQSEIRESMEKLLNKLTKDGNVVEGVNFDLLKYVVAVYYVLTTTEACSNLARYDGVRYGYRSNEYKNFDELIEKTRGEGFGFEVKKRIMFGNLIFETQKENDVIKKAKYLRSRISNELERIFTNNDFIILPTTTTTAFEIGEKIEDEKLYWADIYTVIASIAGMPAVSIPCGKDKNGMPIGIQIIGNRYKDEELIDFVKKIIEGE